MPELPEVENTRRYLVESGLIGRTLTRADVGWARTIKRPSLEDFVLDIPGSTVNGLDRRGKYLLATLDIQSDIVSDHIPSTLILHLGMTGGLRIHDKTQQAPNMTRHTFHLDDGRELRFIDPRKFAKIWLVDDPKTVLPDFGPDPLADDFTAAALGMALSRRNVPIKGLLLDQDVVAGLGNLYVDESLYLAGIHPLKPALGLSIKEISGLYTGIVTALTSALTEYDKSRKEQWPEPSFGLSTWTIPRTKDSPCPKCETPVSKLKVRGRTTYFCPGCQPST